MSPSIPIRSAVSAAAAEAATRQAKKPEVEEQGKTSIYGSVSTNDIAANLKAILAEDENGLCIALSPENISFVGEMKHQDKVKHCGVFDIEIKLDAAVEAVRRTITIKAQE
jgi:ribosomal protein L9